MVLIDFSFFFWFFIFYWFSFPPFAACWSGKAPQTALWGFSLPGSFPTFPLLSILAGREGSTPSTHPWSPVLDLGLAWSPSSSFWGRIEAGGRGRMGLKKWNISALAKIPF